MGKVYFIVGAVVLVVLAGCATNSGLIADHQTNAINTAQDRARFDMSCISPVGTVVSSEVTTPQVGSGGWVAKGRAAKYSVRVVGCGKTNTYTIICTENGSGCTAGDVHQPIPVN